ncbi:type II toxin-antitoxin system YhaV family toxin [Rhizobium sp. AAP116]|uniref:type II toxin-antitoxin system YhaV family toxin n=1 Tax=Rhizobium sp. AAP116 TaxID=1523429 RepID=UPI0006B8AAAA|nr:type II toxin-antitoxin system YhaV family toxin [Rhizobium sp. AAP116]KPF57922.1 toxin [Rhizobium sp. AAP116]
MSEVRAPFAANGWAIYAHPLFLDQLMTLTDEVEVRKRRDPETWRRKNASKRLAAILKLVTTDIPADPGAPQFRQGDTLGSHGKHWFRAKFFQQYRLFFRFDSSRKIIVFVWVNDEDTLRAYGSRSDAYSVFKGMLDNGHPPDDFDAVLKEAKGAAARFAQLIRPVNES